MSGSNITTYGSGYNIFEGVNWFLIAIVVIIIVITICTIFFLTRKLDKEADHKNKTRKERQRKYVKHKLSSFLDDIYSFTEEYMDKVDNFKKYESDFTLADVKKEAFEKVQEVRTSNDLRDIIAMVDTNELEDLLWKLQNTSVTLWKEKCSKDIERVLKVYGEQEKNI